MMPIMPLSALQAAMASMNATKDYGDRIHPILIPPTHQFHNGLDLSAPEGTPLYSPWDGIVLQSMHDEKTTENPNGLNGNFIRIQHDPTKSEGIAETAYAHLASRVAQKGQALKAGALIGYVGSTGRSTGNHLHFVTRKAIGDSAGTDPKPYIESTLKKTVAFGMAGVLIVGAAAVWFFFLRK